MMKCVCDLMRKYDIPTIVSLNPIMVDGTGMCGCCRVTVGGAVKFACVDGPEFDGLQVDFDELMTRLSTYRIQESQALEHYCSETGCRLDAMLEGGSK
jgi:ferredoxin--NADP+ reductase